MKPCRLPRSWIVLLILAFAGVLPSRADLVWEPATGWRVEGGALSLLSEADDARAVDLMNKARAAQEKGHLRTALRNYNRVVRRFGRSVYAPEALYQSGHIRLKRREYSRAFEAFDQIIRRYPNYGKFNELVEIQHGIATDLANGKRQRLWGIFPGFPNRERGIEFLETVVRNAPFSDIGPRALEQVAQGHRRAERTDEEIDALDRFINTYNLDSRAPDAYLDLAKAHESLVIGPRYDQGSTKEALSYFQDFAILYPAHPRVAEAESGVVDMRTMLARNRLMMGDWYLRYRRNYTAARIFYNEVITLFPESDIAARARQNIERVDALEARAKANPPSPLWRYINWLWR